MFNTTGNSNTANGYEALYSNTTGIKNTANGFDALYSNTTGSLNTANGFDALLSNTIGNENTANGYEALYSTTGSGNTANGYEALLHNTAGSGNTANGVAALLHNTTGTSNTANGIDALVNNTTGANNVGLGISAGNQIITANNVICIGAGVGGADVSNTTWIANVYGNATLNAQAAPVVVSVDGQLATVVSSERFKKYISTMETASEVILSLRPVTFHYKTDTKNIPQFGLIAEEVAKVNPALVLPDKEGKPYTVRYDAVNAMLLNEFLKEHRKVEEQARKLSEQDRKLQEQETAIAQQQKDFQATVARLTARLDEQASQIQKVSAQLEANKPAPQVALNNP